MDEQSADRSLHPGFSEADVGEPKKRDQKPCPGDATPVLCIQYLDLVDERDRWVDEEGRDSIDLTDMGAAIRDFWVSEGARIEEDEVVSLRDAINEEWDW